MRSKTSRGFACGELFVPILVIAVLAAVLVPNFIKARRQGQLTACKSNLKNVATALEMYSTDAMGQYPERLDRLVPKYLKSIPGCPSEQPATAYVHEASHFTLTCQGFSHGLLYSSRAGLGEGPARPNPNQISVGRVFLLLFVWYLFLVKLFLRPEPMRVVQDLEMKYDVMAGLGCFGWVALNSLLAYLVYLRFGGVVAPVLAAVSADLLVRAGWFVWGRLSPPPDAVEEKSEAAGSLPRLPGPIRATVPWTPSERARYRAISLAPPLSVLALFTLPVWLADPWQSRLFGLAAAALVAFPLFLWGRRLGQLFLNHQLELLPGTGVVLEHRRRWGHPVAARVGSLNDAVREGNQLRIGGTVYAIQDEDFLNHFG